MNIKTTVIDGIIVREHSPELTEEEEKERINNLAESLISFGKTRMKNRIKTA